MNKNNCECCIWHDSWTWACCNGESEYRADFVNCGCEKKMYFRVADKNSELPKKIRHVINERDVIAIMQKTERR